MTEVASGPARSRIEYVWRGPFTNVELETLHGGAPEHRPSSHDSQDRVGRYSLGWVTARDESLVGFVNVAWDGGAHAFVLDTIVAPRVRRHGVGRHLLAVAEDQARRAGCEWLHVDFEEHLRPFYFDAGGFRPTHAGLIRLSPSPIACGEFQVEGEERVIAGDPSSRPAGFAAREGTFPGGLPYLAVGVGEPLVYLCGSTPNHRNPKPGLERRFTLKTVLPLARRGFEVYFTNRWSGMPVDITWPAVADGHAHAIAEHFGRPVDVLGHSTGGSLVLQLIADHPEVVRRAVVASAAYALGPVAKRAQLTLLHGIEETGHYTPQAMAEMLEGMVRRRWRRALLRPVLALAARRIEVERPADAIAMLRAEDGFDLRDRLGDIETETLVICGAQDYYWTPEMFAETAYRMPRGRLIMYPDLGHALVTSPRFAADVAAFLRR